MSIEYLKRAAKTPETETATAQKIVGQMLAEIGLHGEAAVRNYVLKLGQWAEDIIVTPAGIERRTRDIPATIKREGTYPLILKTIQPCPC